MDPLSISVGIVTILGAGGQVAKGLEKIRSLKYAPDVLLALNNEVSDIECLIHEIENIAWQHQKTNETPVSASICRALDRVKNSLLAFEKLIAYEFTIIDSYSGQVKLDRTRWLQLESKVKQLQEQMRNDKIDLSTALNSLNSYVMNISLFPFSYDNHRSEYLFVLMTDTLSIASLYGTSI